MNSPPRILVVEDQYFIAMDCELTLRAAGYECVGLAKSADEALQITDALRPDLVIMDIRLAHGSDGVDAATRIYDRFGIRSIFASGHADAVIRQQAEVAHPLGWLNKPYTSSGLIDAVQTALQEIAPPVQEAAATEEAPAAGLLPLAVATVIA